MAAGLGSAGANVVLVSRHEDEASAAADQIATAFGRRALGLRADVAKKADTASMVENVL